MENQDKHLNQPGGNSEAIPVGGADPALERKSVPKRLPTPNVMLSEFSLYTDRTLYIDKTLMLKEILDGYPDKGIFLFARPRRFGKTLMMTTLKSFFEKPGAASDVPASTDTSLLFQNRKIWACGERYREEQGKYPVIYLTFKGASSRTWQGLYIQICRILREEADRHPELKNSTKCSESDRDFFRKLIKGSMTPDEARTALRVLSRMLSMHYGTQAILIVDEYDTPLQEAFLHGCYDHVEAFLRGLYTDGLKDNTYLKYVFLAGILQTAKAGIFSGLNNLGAFSVLNQAFSSYFGFTESEIKQIARLYGKEDMLPELYAWYDGYSFGGTRVFNPWSVLYYFMKNCKAAAYWVDTSNNAALASLLEEASTETVNQLMQILDWVPGKQPVREQLNISVIYSKMGLSDTDLYRFLLETGYLKAEHVEEGPGGTCFCDLHIPNREIRELLEEEIVNRFIPESSARYTRRGSLQTAMIGGNPSAFQEAFEELLETASAADLVDEDAYHMLLHGLCLNLASQFIITSNRESEEGRYAIQLEPRDRNRPGILLEVKHVEEEIKRVRQVLQNRARKAIKQALDKHYDTDLKKRGVKTILIYGVACYRKHAAVLLHSPESASGSPDGKGSAHGR